MINLNYPFLLDLFPEHRDPRRSESASFLIWFLENYYRLDPLEAVDSVCDQPGDKGIDGIYVNDNDMTITIFQSRISQSPDSTIGDAALRQFVGTLSQFSNQDSVINIINTGGDSRVVRLIERLDIVNKINTHEVRGEFVCNIDIDANGEDFLRNNNLVNFIGKTQLLGTYISDKRTAPVQATVPFDIVGFHVTEYTVDANTKAVIAPVKATQLVNLKGIADQSLFAFNVRGPLGKTQVNKDIVKSINNPSTHKLFPLFHNGITIIVRQLSMTSDVINVQDYYVVNGCQSLNALYEHKTSLSDDLRILCKFITMEPTSSLSEMVTRYSNNQNGVKARDFMSNNPTQIRLQNEFDAFYKGEYFLEIKRGELSGNGQVITNEEAGLYLMSFDLKEPWGTHRKYQVFEDKHADLFARPEVSADRIVLCHVIIQAIIDASNKLSNSLFAKYLLTKYLILYIVRIILENDDLSHDIFTSPNIFVRRPEDRKRFEQCIKRIVDDIIIDLNAEVDEYGEDFDYRGKLRDEKWVKDISKKVVADFLKLVARGRIISFRKDWESIKGEV